jgi:hypothetical protein
MTGKEKSPAPQASDPKGIAPYDKGNTSQQQHRVQVGRTIGPCDGDLVVLLPTAAHFDALLEVIGKVVARGRREGWLTGSHIEVLRFPLRPPRR